MVKRIRPSAICTRYVVFCVNFLLFITSSLLILIAIYAIQEQNTFDKLSNLGSSFKNPTVILIISSIILWISGLCGMLGSLRENIFLLRIYMISNCIFLFVLIVLTILFTVAYESFTSAYLAKYLHKCVTFYRFEADYTGMMDWFQQDFGKCCGVQTPNDWQNNAYFNCTSQIEINGQMMSPSDACSVPWSCCRNGRNNTLCGRGFLKDFATSNISNYSDVFLKGCLDAVSEKIVKYPVVMIVVCVSLTIIPLCALCAASTIISRVHKY